MLAAIIAPLLLASLTSYGSTSPLTGLDEPDHTLNTLAAREIAHDQRFGEVVVIAQNTSQYGFHMPIEYRYYNNLTCPGAQLLNYTYVDGREADGELVEPVEKDLSAAWERGPAGIADIRKRLLRRATDVYKEAIARISTVKITNNNGTPLDFGPEIEPGSILWAQFLFAEIFRAPVAPEQAGEGESSSLTSLLISTYTQPPESEIFYTLDWGRQLKPFAPTQVLSLAGWVVANMILVMLQMTFVRDPALYVNDSIEAYLALWILVSKAAWALVSVRATFLALELGNIPGYGTELKSTTIADIQLGVVGVPIGLGTVESSTAWIGGLANTTVMTNIVEYDANPLLRCY